MESVTKDLLHKLTAEKLFTFSTETVGAYTAKCQRYATETCHPLKQKAQELKAQPR